MGPIFGTSRMKKLFVAGATERMPDTGALERGALPILSTN